MSLNELADLLESAPDGMVAEAVRLHRSAVTAAAEAAPAVIDSLGLASPDDLDFIPMPVLLREVAERTENDRTRAVLIASAAAFPEIEAGQDNLSPEAASGLAQVTAGIEAAEDFGQLETAVEQARERFGYMPELGTGLEVAQAILADGSTTIYNEVDGPLAAAFRRTESPEEQREPKTEPEPEPEPEPAREPEPEAQPAQRRVRRKILFVAKRDVSGAAAGGAGGAVFGPHGALLGAAGAALMGSVGSVVQGVLDWMAPDT